MRQLEARNGESEIETQRTPGGLAPDGGLAEFREAKPNEANGLNAIIVNEIG